MNWFATLAAVAARGQRCDKCSAWTFRPQYRDLPKYVARLCPECLPLIEDLPEFMIGLFLSQTFKSDLEKGEI